MDSNVELLNRLAKGEATTESDETALQAFLAQIGFPGARVLCGMVYMPGEAQPYTMSEVAQAVMQVLKSKGIDIYQKGSSCK